MLSCDEKRQTSFCRFRGNVLHTIRRDEAFVEAFLNRQSSHNVEARVNDWTARRRFCSVSWGFSPRNRESLSSPYTPCARRVHSSCPDRTCPRGVCVGAIDPRWPISVYRGVPNGRLDSPAPPVPAAASRRRIGHRSGRSAASRPCRAVSYTPDLPLGEYMWQVGGQRRAASRLPRCDVINRAVVVPRDRRRGGV